MHGSLKHLFGQKLLGNCVSPMAQQPKAAKIPVGFYQGSSPPSSLTRSLLSSSGKLSATLRFFGTGPCRPLPLPLPLELDAVGAFFFLSSLPSSAALVRPAVSSGVRLPN